MFIANNEASNEIGRLELIVSLSIEVYSPRRPGMVDEEIVHVFDNSCR